jgi:hypothetical protein
MVLNKQIFLQVGGWQKLFRGWLIAYFIFEVEPQLGPTDLLPLEITEEHYFHQHAVL